MKNKKNTKNKIPFPEILVKNLDKIEIKKHIDTFLTGFTFILIPYLIIFTNDWYLSIIYVIGVMIIADFDGEDDYFGYFITSITWGVITASISILIVTSNSDKYLTDKNVTIEEYKVDKIYKNIPIFIVNNKEEVKTIENKELYYKCKAINCTKYIETTITKRNKNLSNMYTYIETKTDVK